MSPSPKSRRTQPRAPVRLKARVTVVGKKGSTLEATLSSADLSVGGVFLESTFFLKGDQRVEVELALPQGKVVKARGEIIRAEDHGFAVKFTGYTGKSEQLLGDFLAKR